MKIKITLQIQFLCLFYGCVSQTIPMQAMLKEFVWQSLAWPRKKACLCALPDSSMCKARALCSKMLISIHINQNKDVSEPSQEHHHVTLLIKHTIFKSHKVGGISYSFSKGKAGYIKNVLLDDTWHNKGLGFLLMQHALHEMENQHVTHVTLAVGDWNKQAIALYEKCNFVVHERITHAGASIMICTNLSHGRSKKK